MKKFVKYLPQFKAFGLADKEWEELSRAGFVTFELSDDDSDDDYARLGCKKPKKNAPIIGILFGRENGFYCVDWNYVLAVAKTGARVVFIDYVENRGQVMECDGIVLPGGSFESPEAFYTDAKTKKVKFPNERSRAYADCIRDALEYKMPGLYICGGAQMMAGMAGMKLFRAQEGYFETPIAHKTQEPQAHRVWFKQGSPLYGLLHNQKSMMVRSRHSEFLAPEKVQRETLNLVDGDKLPLEIYATASDGIPEAWGDMEHGILCIQWHPEDDVALGDAMQQRIYQWVYDEAARCR